MSDTTKIALETAVAGVPEAAPRGPVTSEREQQPC